MTKCSITGCQGEYEKRLIVHTVKHHGQIIVINDVPADVCSICGDTLLTPDTARKIERLLQMRTRPTKTVPLYEFV